MKSISYKALMQVVLISALLWLGVLGASAQDGLNLPTELYILRNDGVLEQYGLGAAGIRTVTPEGAFVVDFRVAPDGVTLAYRTPEALILRQMERQTEQVWDSQASAPAVRGQGETLAWSPTGDALLMTTLTGARVYFLATGQQIELALEALAHVEWSPDGRYAALVTPEGIWWIHKRDGDSLSLTSIITSANGAVWAEADALWFAPPEGGIVRMDLANGNAQSLLLEARRTYYALILTPEGKLRAFTGTPEAARLVEWDASAPLPTELGTVDFALAGARWLPNAGGLVRFVNGTLGLVNPFDGTGFNLPIALSVAYGWGAAYPSRINTLALPSPASFLARVGATGVLQAWLLSAQAELPSTLTPAEDDVSEYSLSPDASRIAYVSAGSLWSYRLEGEAPRRIVELNLPDGEQAQPAYAPDNQTLYFRHAPEVDGERLAGIWRVVDEGEPELFLPDEPERVFLRATPAPDVPALLIEALTPTPSQADLRTLFSLLPTGENLEVLAYQMDWAKWLRNGELIAAQGERLFLFDVNQPAPQTLPPAILTLREARIVDAVRLAPQSWRVALHSVQAGVPVAANFSLPTRLLIVDVAEGGDPQLVGDVGFWVDGRLSSEGDLLAGRFGAGALVFYDVENGASAWLDVGQMHSMLMWRG